MLAGLGALTALTVAQREGAALQARFAERRDNKQAMERFREAASQHGDVESLMQDRRTLQVVLEAFQLKGEIDKRGILRRILTEDPAAEGSLANRLTDRRWRDLAKAFATREASALTPTQVAALSTTEVRGISLGRMGGLTADQLQALTASQVQALSTSQIRAIDSNEILGLDAADLRAMSRDQVSALRPSQLAALSAAQVKAMEAEDIAALGASQMRGLGATQLRALTTTQLDALGFEQLQALTRDQVAALSPDQRASLTAAQSAALGTAFEPSASEAAADARADRTGPFDDPALLDRLVADAMTNRYEKAMGESNAGLREALYFIRNASRATSINELMADKALTAVVRGALALPESFAALEFDQQKTILANRVKLEELQDPRATAKIALRYLALSAPAQTTVNPVLSLFGGGASLNSLVGSSLSLRA
ncbi:DUF1217 domain-containing protein [Falsiroseomonas sp. E2-1-a20]|uniref:DUF1217 domain-containing protein n=1 Tax=Falsiroseomonas sp. E2-1-a20 TaxID=3239300 RepID=UPI003F3653DE